MNTIDISTLTERDLCKMFDHTNLKAFATEEDFRKLCAEAVEYGFAMVAINESPVAFCKSLLAGTPVHVGAAIAFPLGQTDIACKVSETGLAIRAGAERIGTSSGITIVREFPEAEGLLRERKETEE